VFFVFIHTLQKYQNVINEHHDKLVQLWHENWVNKVHVVCWCICQSKCHDKIFIETISCFEGCLGYIFSTNLNLVISGVEINFGEHLRLVDQIGSQYVEVDTCSWWWLHWAVGNTHIDVALCPSSLQTRLNSPKAMYLGRYSLCQASLAVESLTLSFPQVTSCMRPWL
jgi:hypothetical protein